jgi:serine phosphatase RsbU (regulator of sigma subunit)
VVADVADKGLGAALYMALSRTLLRTYATEYSTRHPDTYAFHPERVLDTVNQCILQDTQSDLFVTVFFGIIDPKMSTLTYANAGHNPPYLFTHQNGDNGKVVVHDLKRTGIPVGIVPDTSWERGSVRFEPGDVLVVYTDGLVDAENASRDYYGGNRVIELVNTHLDHSAGDLRALLLDGVRDFVGETPSIDDITLMVVKRESPPLP